MEITESIDLITDLVGEALEKSAHQIGVLVMDSAKDNSPQPVTSRLRDSITYDVIPADDCINITVGTNMEYAMYVEFGTGKKGDPSVPHTSKEFWRYKGEDGQWHTSHGTVARPYLRPAIYDNVENIKDIIAGECEKVFE